MDDHELLRKYWGTFGHLDFEPGEILSKDDIVGSGAFTDQEADRLVILLDCSSSLYRSRIKSLAIATPITAYKTHRDIFK